MTVSPQIEVKDDCDFLNLKVIKNPFDTTDIISEELQYDPAKSLAGYLEGLEHRDTWLVGYNGLVAKPAVWKDVQPKPGDLITMTRIPEGGGGGKNILRLVAMIALAVFAAWAAPYVAGAIGLGTGAAAVAGVTAAITIGGSLLINALLPPVTPQLDNGNSIDTSSSFGIDGPKNTSREDAPLAVGYGTYRVAGNLADLYTVNSGDTQYLYVRSALMDGEIEEVSEIEINDQPIANFTEVQTRIRYGTEDEDLNDWFDDSVRLVNRSVKLGTSWTVHTTDGEVDKIRIDLSAPNGLVKFSDQGKELTHSVDFNVEYREVGSSTWAPLPVSQLTEYSGSTGYVNHIGVRVGGNGNPLNDLEYGYTTQVEYSPVGQNDWNVMGSASGGYKATGSNVIAPTEANDTLQDPGFTQTFEQEVPEGEYEVRIQGDGSIQNLYGYPTTGLTSYTMSGNRTKAQRKSLISRQLPRGEYEVRVRRTSAVSTDSRTTDTIYLTDVGEIDVSPVKMNGTANLSLRVKLTDQINNIPKVTALCKLAKLKEYDRDGNFVVERWSANPAWIFVDILTNPLRGAGMSLNRFDWDAIVEWAEHCDAEGLEFNGVFDYQTSVWDAAQAVLRTGHAQIIRLGTRWSVAIDRADTPVMEFNDTNMLRDSLSVEWVPLADRANEIQLHYADKNDGYKRKTIRLVDNDIGVSGEMSKVASYAQAGITDVDQAAAEAEYQLRRNKLIKRTVKFDAPIEAIGLVPGDVAEIHYSAGDYAGGAGGKIEAGATTTTIPLDRPVVIESGESYSVLVYHSAIKRYNVTIQSISGNNVFVSGLPSGELETCARLLKGSADVEVVDIYDAGSNMRVRVKSTEGLSTGAAELWDTNVIEERTVTTGAGETETLTVSPALTAAPSQYANFIFGKVTETKNRFRLMGISGDDINRRSLSFTEYSDALYLPPGAILPSDPPVVIGSIAHAINVSVIYNPFPTGDTSKTFVSVSWDHEDALNYAGADVYIKRNDTPWERVKTVYDVTSADIALDEGDVVEFKVIAFDKQGRRAPSNGAPTSSLNVVGEYRELAAPTGLAVDDTYFDINGRIRLRWTPPAEENVTNYRVDYKSIDATTYAAIQADPTLGEPQDDWSTAERLAWEAGFENAFTTSGLSNFVHDLPVGYYQFRVRAERGLSYSAWEVLTYDLEAPNFIGAITGLRLDKESGGSVTTHNDTATVTVTVGSPTTGGGGGTPEPGPADGTLTVGRTEAETMTVGGSYFIETGHSVASNGQVLRVNSSGQSGTATATFTGNAGTFDIEVFFINENDGESDFDVRVNGDLIGAWTGAGGASGAGVQDSHIISNVTLEPGDSLQFWGRADNGEYARLDCVDVTRLTGDDGSGGTETPVPAPTPPATGGTAENDSLSIAVDATGSINVLTNDNAPNGTYAVVSFTQPANGTVTETSPGVFQYVPDSGYEGHDTFTYTVEWETTASATSGTFTGNEPTFVWDDIFSSGDAAAPYILKYYEVNILDADDNVVRTEYVNEARYTYTYDRNNSDSAGQSFAARRTFKFNVRAIGRQNQESAPAEMEVTNPAPNLAGAPSINGTTVNIPMPNDADFRGFRIWVKETDNIDPATDDYFDILQNEFKVTAPEGADRFFKYAPFDAFDRDPATLNVSDSYSVTGEVFSATDLDYTSFASGYEPNYVVDVLPDPAGYEGPSVVFLTTDKKLYRYDASVPEWVTSIPASDISGQLAEEHIGDGTISARTFAAGLTVPELKSSLPNSDNFDGRLVTLTTDGKIYRYYDGAWTASVAAADISGTLGSGQIGNDAITAVHIGDNVITAAHIGANQVTTNALAAGSVTANIIGADAVTAAKIQAGAIGTDHLQANSITAAKIGADEINANHIASNSINTGHIIAGAITTDELAANAVTADKVAANSITAGKISVGSLSAISANLGTITAGSLNINNKFIVASNGTTTIRSGTSGQRLVITQSRIEVYDSSNTLRVRLGIW